MRSCAFFERHAEDPGVCCWHKNALSVAIKDELYSYVEEALVTRDVAVLKKQGRPLLHYAIERSYSLDRRLKMMRLLFSKGCRPESEFNFRSTWEYFLVDIYVRPSQWMTSEDDACALLFSEYGADLNQQVIFLNYHCFVLHSLEY